MKKICMLSFIFLLSSVNLFAGSIQSYQELADAMRAGDRFTIVLNLHEATCNFSMPIGYFAPSKMMLVGAVDHNDEKIITSDMHFTDRAGFPAYEYIKYTFKPDNTLTVHAAIYNPVTFESIGSDHVINSTIGNGVKIFTAE